MVTVLLLCTIVVVAGAAFVRSFRFADEGRGAADTFALLVGFVAAVMLLGAELFFVDDAFGWRANTVFRFWHQGWLVLAVVGAWGLYRVTEKWNVRAVPGVVWRSGLVAVCGGLVYSVVVALDPAEELYSRWWTATGGLLVAGAVALALAVAGAMRGGSLRVAAFRLPVLAVTAVVLTCAFVYPVLVVFERTGGFRNDQTVDGLYFVRQANPDEYEAIQWLNDNASGSPVILEGFGDDFSEAGRVSSRTGLPTVLGWVGHEIEWRGVPEPTADFLGEPPFVFREDVIGLAYLTPDPAEAEAILRAYRVEYVFLGELERTTYSQSGFTKFSRFMELAYRNGTVTIYRMPETPVLLGSARGQP